MRQSTCTTVLMRKRYVSQAKKVMRWQATALYIFYALAKRTKATPAVAFPFNSQVPTVARVGEPYFFQFSASTFAPEDTNFTYSLSDQPQWLSVDSATRTLSGDPSQADVGASSFTLTAADSNGAAHMSCTLVISKDPAPEIEWDVSQQLASTANLSSSQPPVVPIQPGHEFRFDFRQDSFIDIVQRKLKYYATLADHTPLPAWLLFNAQELVFSGTAPQLSSFPQSWDVELIASDVEGFAGAAAHFKISVATQQLVFVPEQFEVTITDGMDMDFTEIRNALVLNGVPVAVSELKEVEATPPSWVNLDKQTLDLFGKVPEDATDETFEITVTDQAGNKATATIHLNTGKASLFMSQIGSITARAGHVLDYQFPGSLFAQRDVDLTITLPGDARWLTFDSDSRTLSGKVPSATSSSTIEAEITAEDPDTAVKETQSFTIKIEAPTSESRTTVTATSVSSTTSTDAAAPTTVFAADEEDHDPELSKGAIAAAVIGPLIVVALLAALLLCCLRRRRRRKHGGYVDASSPAKRTISRPILPSDGDAITVITDIDVEKHADAEPQLNEHKRRSHAPQLSLGLPVHRNSRKSKIGTRFSNISHVSSLGNGEDAIRGDSNIPEWGTHTTALHHHPHDSFSVPAEMARSSRHLSDMSPSAKALKRLKEKRQSQQSVGLGIDTGGGNVLPRHSSRGVRSHRKAFSSIGQSTIPDGSSVASIATRGTSILSTRPSDFPRPPARGGIRSVPAVALSEADKRKSIRLVGRSDSIQDARSIQEKRQSFIRNRASSSIASPLFAHGSRASIHKKQNGQGSASGSVGSRQSRSKLSRSQITSYSESSSLEPPPRDSRRLSSRLRSTFAPNYPRAVTRSTLYADDEGITEDGESELWDTTDSEDDLPAQLAKPRHQRNFVLPGEASPTPPPAPPTSRQVSSSRRRIPSSNPPRQKWKDRLRDHSSSPLSTAVAVPVSERSSPNPEVAATKARRSTLSEPLSLISNDSLSRGKHERPRLVHTNSKRPVSVEKVQRLSSLKAETEDTRPGSEMWEAMEGAGLMPPNSSDMKDGTQRSNGSGAVFL